MRASRTSVAASRWGQTGFGRARCTSSSAAPGATLKCVGSTTGAWAGSRLFTASIPNRSVVASQSRHSSGPLAASQGWMSMSGFLSGRGRSGVRAGGSEKTAGDTDVRSQPAEVGDELVGGVVELCVGHRVEGVEDEQRRGGVVGELGAACLAPVPGPAGDAGVVAPHHLARV